MRDIDTACSIDRGDEGYKALSCLSQDVTSREDGSLIGRAFVSAATLTTLQGSISATIMSPQLDMVCPDSHSLAVVCSQLHAVCIYDLLGTFAISTCSATSRLCHTTNTSHQLEMECLDSDSLVSAHVWPCLAFQLKAVLVHDVIFAVPTCSGTRQSALPA